MVNRQTHLLENSPASNGFVANVNELVNNLDLLEEVNGKSEQYEQIRTEVESNAQQVQENKEAIDNAVSQITGMKNDVEDMVQHIDIAVEDLDKAVDKATEQAIKAAQSAAKVDAANTLAVGISNTSDTVVITSDIAASGVLTFPQLAYYVGRDTLHVSWEGAELYKNRHYEEMGEEGEISHSIRLLIDIPIGHQVYAWGIASNISRHISDIEENVEDIHEDILGEVDRAQEILDKINDANTLAEGIINHEVTIKTTTPIMMGDTIQLDNFLYYVGRHILRVNCDNRLLILDRDYVEVGEDGATSNKVMFSIDIPAGTDINFWCVSSNIARMAEFSQTSIDRAEEILNRVGVQNNVVSNLVQEATEQADRADQAAIDANDALRKINRKICSLPVISFDKDTEQDEVPIINSVFWYGLGMDCNPNEIPSEEEVAPNRPSRPNTPVLPSDPSYPADTIVGYGVCGKRIRL